MKGDIEGVCAIGSVRMGGRMYIYACNATPIVIHACWAQPSDSDRPNTYMLATRLCENARTQPCNTRNVVSMFRNMCPDAPDVLPNILKFKASCAQSG